MFDKDKADEVQEGLIVNQDSNGDLIEGPFFTGGPSSPVGLDLPVSTFYVQNDVSGIKTWKKFGAGVNDWRQVSAQDIPVDPTNLGNYTSTDMQSLSEEIDTSVSGFNTEFEHRGWEQITDTQYISTNKLAIAKNARTLLPNNAGAIINSQLPLDVTTFWNNVTNKFEPDRVGDFYSLRLSFITSANKNNAQGTVELDIGGAQGVIWSQDIFYTKGANTDISVAKTIPAYTLATFVNNGGEFYITVSEAAQVYDISLVVYRSYRGR